MHLVHGVLSESNCANDSTCNFHSVSQSYTVTFSGDDTTLHLGNVAIGFVAKDELVHARTMDRNGKKLSN